MSAAQSCGGSYVIQRGDSLSLIAVRAYKDAFLWTDIYTLNRARIGANPDTILEGTLLDLPCLNADETQVVASVPDASAAEPQDSLPEVAPRRYRLITLQDFPPFSHQSNLGAGLLVELVAQMGAYDVSLSEAVLVRVPDSAAMRRLKTTDQQINIIFPIGGTDCTPLLEKSSCTSFLRSDPVFEAVTGLYALPSDRMIWPLDASLGRPLVCHQEGSPADLVETEDRNWQRDGLVELTNRPTVRGCFLALARGDVDAVYTNDVTARAVQRDMENSSVLEGITAIPLGVEPLYLAVAADVEGAEDLIAGFNAAFSAVLDAGQYQPILNKYLAELWAGS